MINSILRLLAASASFVALLLITNSTIAAPLEPIQVHSPSLSLNLISPSLQLASDESYTPQHLGCSCALCTKAEITSDRL